MPVEKVFRPKCKDVKEEEEVDGRMELSIDSVIERVEEKNQ